MARTFSHHLAGQSDGACPKTDQRAIGKYTHRDLDVDMAAVAVC